MAYIQSTIDARRFAADIFSASKRSKQACNNAMRILEVIMALRTSGSLELEGDMEVIFCKYRLPTRTRTTEVNLEK